MGANVAEARAAVTVRAIGSTDDAALRLFYAELSDDSRALRFLGPTPCLGTTLARSFCSPDHEHREGFVAVLVDPDLGDERIVGHLCVEPCNDITAEIAVAVADAMQGQGIGRRLVEAGVTWARAAGLRRLVATAFVSNAAILGLLRSLGLPVHVELRGCGTCHVSIDLATLMPAAA